MTTSRLNEHGVLVDATALDTGHRRRGIGRYVEGLVRGLVENGVRPSVLRLEAGQTGGDVPGGEIPELPTHTIRRPRDKHFVRFLCNEAMLERDLRRIGPRVYHTTEPWSLPVSQHFATVATVHDTIPLTFRQDYGGFGNLQWKIYYDYLIRKNRWNQCDRIIAISDATRLACIEELGIADDRIRVVYNGIDHTVFVPQSDRAIDAVKQKYALDRAFVFYVGGYDHRKNVDVLVKAWVNAGLEVDLVLAGGMSDNQRLVFQEIAAAREHEGELRFPGFVPDSDVPALYGAARLFAYPSLAEGFGLQILEAMACGCPVLTSDRSSLLEVAGHAALTVDPTRVDDVANGLSELSENEGLRAEMKKQGYSRSREFSWERCARETAAVYAELS